MDSGIDPFSSPSGGAASDQKPDEVQELPVEVSIDAHAYYRTELKNLGLSLLTLGIYSAWAKVQRRKLFFEHTHLDGRSFGFTANPKTILRSRAIVVAMMIASALMKRVDPRMEDLESILLFLVMPWALITATAFHTRHTTYGGQAFSFHASISQAYKATLKGAGICLLTFGLGVFVPLAHLTEHSTNSTSYQRKPFRFQFKNGPYIKLGAFILGITLLAFVAAILIHTGLSDALGIKTDLATDETSPAQDALWTLAFAPPFAFVFGAFEARLHNLCFAGLSYGPHRFRSNMRATSLGLIYLTSVCAIVGTLGLAIPWALLRRYKYLMSKITVITTGPLIDEHISMPPEPEAPSDAIGDAFLDLAL